MSGIEIAGLVFGVIPLVVQILKHYGTAKSRLISFSRHSEVVCDIQLGFQVAAANFNNDCRLLLQTVVDYPAEVSEMMENPADKRWQEQSSNIEKRLRGLMEGDYDLCHNIVTRVRDILHETQESLVKLESGLRKTKHSQHELVHKIWHAFNTSRKENEYVRQIELLDKWNKALGKLRKQRCKIAKRRSVSSACVVRKAVPRSYQQIRLASKHVGESLRESWSCRNISHDDHQAKLLLDAQNGYDDVQLDIVVACCLKLTATHTKSLQTEPIWLRIRSNPIAPLSNGSASSISMNFNPLHRNLLQRTTQDQENSRPKGRKSKRVRFDNSGGDKHARRHKSISTDTDQAQSFLMLDLRTTNSVCCHVSQVRSSTSTFQDGCVGYLDVNATPTTRLIFYDASRLATQERPPLPATREATSINTLVKRLQISQQIILAHKLSEVVLQYHSTSWLPQTWTLQDVAYFKETALSDPRNISNELKSLHLSNRLRDHESPDINTKQEFLDLKHIYGIRNLTLAKLGVALLEICAQRDITVPGLNRTPQEIFEARKLLDEKHSSIMTLGNRYLEVVRKCIYCDFSCDDDLGGEALQSAVYTEVVGVLQEMKTRWEKFSGISNKEVRSVSSSVRNMRRSSLE